MSEMLNQLTASLLWRARRLRFAARHEWLRVPPYVLPYAGFQLLYGPGNALVFRYCLNGFYEKDVERYLAATLPADAIVIDAGSNIGFFTLTVLGSSPGATVHGFEPSPGAFALYEAAIARNGLRGRVFPNRLALHSEVGEMDFQIHADAFGAYDGFRNTNYAGVGEPRTVKVPVTTLDQYADRVGLRRLDLLKIDVEGAELFVLRGARDVLTTLRPKVLFEVGYKNLRPFGLLPADLHRYLRTLSYGVHTLGGTPLSEADLGHAALEEHEFVAVPDR